MSRPGPDAFERAGASLAERVTTGLSKIGLALKSQAWQQAGPQGLTPTQGQILALLAARPPEGMRVAELAAALGVTSATASDAIRTLAIKEHVDKERSEPDARVVRVRLTERGRREAKAAAAWPDFLLAAVGELSEAEQEVFLTGLVKMIRALQERGQISVARMCVTCRYFRPNLHKDPVRPHHCAFADAAFGPRHLRLDCPDHEAAETAAERSSG
jgi:DNA-binding MarR family transcriptional regulator